METKKKILLVDDDIDVINVLETILENEGYEIISANDKKEGFSKIKEVKPDLAILDVMMTTYFEGFEMAKEINDTPELRDIPVLMLTSVEVLKTSRPDLQAMAREYRKKPGYKELNVILIKDVTTGEAGIDYLSEEGKSVWFPVNGFLNKPVDSKSILPEVKRLLNP